MDIQTIHKIEKEAAKSSQLDFLRLGLGLVFMAVVLGYSFLKSGDLPNNIFLAIAALFGAYMAMNIGANDVANNVGPAVGSKALTMFGAILIASVFELLGAIVAGGDVVSTIKSSIIDINKLSNSNEFIWIMMASLLAAALWLNVATYFKAPVSTTHSVVGAVMGAGIAASGFWVVSWKTLGKIASSWVISPILGGVIAALFLYLIKITIINKDDKIKSSITWVPIFISIMAWAFVTYIILKGLSNVWSDLAKFLPFLGSTPSFDISLSFGFVCSIIVFAITKISIKKNSSKMQNSREDVNKNFTIPLIFAAALLSFAHGANDVANAIGPLAAINDVVMNGGGISTSSNIPLWVMLVGAIGISLGLSLYGPKLIKTVGGEITELDQIRAFSVAMAAALTVILASWLGLPVSSTHIAIGGIFGIGFLREFLSSGQSAIIEYENQLIENEKKNLQILNDELLKIESKSQKDKEDYKQIVKIYRLIDEEEAKIKKSKKKIKSAEKIRFVKRDTIKKIIAAWLITVPIAAILSAMIYFMIRGIVL